MKELIADTAKQICDLYKNDSLDEIKKCITEFYEKCTKKSLRISTMKLIVKTREIVSTKDDDDNYCIQQILIGFDIYLKGKSERFLQDFLKQTISKNLWKTCIANAFLLDAKTHGFALDRLLHLRKPESDDRKASLYSRITHLLHSNKTVAEEWIRIFKIDRRALVTKTASEPSTVADRKETKPSLTTAASQEDDSSWRKLVEDTFKQFQADIINDSFDPKCLTTFFENCPKDSLRAATMELIIEINKLMSKDSDPLSVIRTIFIELDEFLKGKDDLFIEEIRSGYVWGKLWDECFQVIVPMDVTGCKFSLDLMFHSCKPETKKRSLLIYQSVRNLLLQKETFNKGIEWIQIFDLDLEKLKIRSIGGNVEDEDGISVSPIPPLINPAELRAITMEKILKVFENATSEMADNELLYTVHGIYKNFEACLKDKDEDFVKEVISAEVADDLWMKAWEKCFAAASNKTPAKCTVALDQLFSLRNHENDVRKALFEADVRKLLDQNNTFINGVRWIEAFNLSNIREEEFEKIIYNLFIFGKEGSYPQVLPTKDAQFRCLRLLDDCLHRAENDQLQNEAEKKFIKFITIEKLPERIYKFSHTFKVDIEKQKFHACRILTVQKIKHMYAFLDRNYFELYVSEALKDKDEKYILGFLDVISDDQKYAYCWAKYFLISAKNMPEFLKNCEHFELAAIEFIKTICKRVQTPVDKDQIETCQFWKKTYQLITVMTPKAFNNFVEKYLIHSKPKIIGIDCEGKRYEQKAVVLQLATTEWAALIDIQELFNKLSPKQWKNFFQLLFDPNITLVGFAFRFDFVFLCNTFSYLSTFLEQIQAKVLCLQKFSDEMIKDKKCSKIFLQKPPKGCGLATLTKAVLGLSLDKTEQQSKWHKRPLTQFQKIYAVTDALVVVLIKNEIEKRLNEEIGENATMKLMEKAYDHHGNKKMNQKKKEKKIEKKKMEKKK